MPTNENQILFPTAYNPSVLWFSFALLAKEILIEIEENFPKQTLRNRMEILGPNGIHVLSVPIKKSENLKKKTKDVQISYDTDWQKNHRKSIETAYNSSPYFLYYQDYFLPFYTNRWENLIDFNAALIKTCFRCLKIEKEIIFTSEYHKETSKYDLRTYFEKNHSSSQSNFTRYIQVFSSKFDFMPNLSILDLLFNLGPESVAYLKALASQLK